MIYHLADFGLQFYSNTHPAIASFLHDDDVNLADSDNCIDLTSLESRLYLK